MPSLRYVHSSLPSLEADRGQAEEELFQRLVKKFGQSSKAWTLFGQFYLTRGRPTEARDLLPRSLKSLEKRKRA